MGVDKEEHEQYLPFKMIVLEPHVCILSVAACHDVSPYLPGPGHVAEPARLQPGPVLQNCAVRITFVINVCQNGSDKMQNTLVCSLRV